MNRAEISRHFIFAQYFCIGSFPRDREAPRRPRPSRTSERISSCASQLLAWSLRRRTLGRRPMASTRGSPGVDLGRSQAARCASIARSTAYRRLPTSARSASSGWRMGPSDGFAAATSGRQMSLKGRIRVSPNDRCTAGQVERQLCGWLTEAAWGSRDAKRSANAAGRRSRRQADGDRSRPSC